MDDEKEVKEETEENEDENLRDIILQQLANLEQSDVSDDDSYKVRLSCILEDDESESSGTGPGVHKELFSKEIAASRERTKESEKGPPEALETLIGVRDSMYDSEVSDDFACENVQITDLDDVTLCDEKEKTEDKESTPESEKGFAIKKLKSSDNVHKRPFIVRRRELSSDSSDMDISISNSVEGPPSDLKIVELNEEDDEKTMNIVRGSEMVESETSVEEEPEAREVQEREKSGELEVVDNETLSEIFAKVSRTYLEKTKSNVKWEENEKIDHIFHEVEEELKKKKKDKNKEKESQSGDQLSFSDMHIRGTSPKVYDPPVPPETYLWEELKRLRERGGYPWTYLDKPPFDEATWKKYMEHVYEPINPPPLSTEYKGETSKEEIKEKAVFKGPSIPETEKSITRIPSDHDLPKKEPTPVPEAKSSENVAEKSAQKIQEEMENRFLTPSPSSSTAPPLSQSKTDVTPSDLDSTEIDDLPIKQKSLVKTRREQMRAQAQEIQQRLRNHAGRIRDRFSHIQRPTLGRKERSLNEPSTSGEEKSRFKFPEMHAPKITLPDRSKFKLPEKAKFHLPESAKFHLPDKSKFHLPDRSKFHLPEKGKFHLPERPKLNLVERAKMRLPERGRFQLPDKSKFHLPDRSKFHLPERAKFHLPDKAKFHLPEKAKFHLPDRSKFHLPERAKFNLPNRPKLEMPKLKRTPREGPTSPSTLKSRFDFDLKSYPKLFTKHSKDYTTSSPKQTRGRTPPPRMKGEEIPAQSSGKWMQKLDDDLKYADDDLESAGARETDSRKSESLFEREGYMEDFEKMPQEIRTISTKSSTSRLSDKDISEYSDDRKKGVLEEINPDEFFLRQKGISQDDIDMGKYLSREIREAFRSPDINALARLDYMDVDDENVDPARFQREPQRPKRTGSIKKKSILKKTSTSDPSLAEDGYKTYPPRRPGRKSRSQSKSLLNEDAAIDQEGYEEPDVNLSRYDNIEYEDENLSEYYKSPGPAIEYQHYKVPRSHAPVSPSPPLKRKSSVEDEGSNKRLHEGWDEHVMVMPSEPPKPVARRKHKKKAMEMESFGEQEQIPQEILKEQEEAVPLTEMPGSPVPPVDTADIQAIESQIQETKVPEPPMPAAQLVQSPAPEPKVAESPVPPKRTRTRSSGSRSLRSLAMEDDVNRSFHSEPPIERLEELEDEMITEQTQSIENAPLVKSASEFLPSRTHEYEITDLDDVGFGYATIGKPTAAKPDRQKKPKPERPPPPRRKKEVSVPIYNTYPRRAPVRPLRNYSTLGPSRPPRGKKISPIEKALSERQLKASTDMKQSDFTEPLDFIEVGGSSKDLKTEKVIEKMKGRPLPPPPRPPRQKSKEPDDLEPTEEEKLSLSILKDEEFPLERTITAFVHEPPIDRQVVEEICTSTQTDPLPEDFSFGTDESDMIQEFSHEQLRIQQAFLEEMKKEEEEMRQRSKNNEGDLIDAELKAEVIRQIEDIIAEEKRILEERKSSDRFRREESAPDHQKDFKPGKSYLDVDADMGYASLERKKDVQPRQQAQPITPQPIPQKLEKLQVQELDVGTLNVHEVQSDQIFVKELQSNRIASQDIDNTGGTMALGNIDLPPSFIEQIVAKIPWDSLRQSQGTQPPQDGGTTPTLLTPPVRPQRRQRGSHQEDSEEETPVHHRKSHRRHHRPHYSSEEEDRRSSERVTRRPAARVSESPRNIPELSLQLARACTSASVQALRSFVQTNATFAQSLDRELCVQAILCIAVALVAAFFLFGFDAKIVHTHRWDFQFPPQPPNDGV